MKNIINRYLIYGSIFAVTACSAPKINENLVIPAGRMISLGWLKLKVEPTADWVKNW